MVRPLQLQSLGGYIPFVNLPCERDIGESIKWVIVLATLPWNCKLVPWLCCPIPFDPELSEIAISTDITCDDPRAPIGGIIHWSMVGISIAGLILALLHLGECALVQTNVLEQEFPTTLVFNIDDTNVEPDPFTAWFDEIEKTLQDFQKDYLIWDTNFDPDHSLTIDVPVESIDPSGLLGFLTNFGSRPRPFTTRRESAGPSLVKESNTEEQIAKVLSNLTLPENVRLALTVPPDGGTQLPTDKSTKTNTTLTPKSQIKIHYDKTSPETVYIDASSLGLAPSKRKGKKFKMPIGQLLEGGIISRNGTRSRRVRRQAELNVPIPISRSFYSGEDDDTDEDCERNEVKVDDDEDDYESKTKNKDDDEDDEEDDTEDDDKCYEVLKRGPCDETEIVLMDPVTRKGFCGPRLCSPDRVFLYSDQLCHDPHEIGLCPPGRQLFTTSFGTPVCGCEDGFYEMEDDDDDDVCRPLLTEIPSCDPGKVFWFKSFRNPPKCLPDPCKGLNLNRRYSELPYVPALHDNKCYQLGTRPDFCRSDEYLALDLTKLRGVCQSLQDAGYLTLDSGILDKFKEMFGSSLSKESPVTALPLKLKTKHAPPFTKINWNTKPGYPVIGTPVVPPVRGYGGPSPPLVIGQSVVPGLPTSQQETDGSNPWSHWTLVPTHVSAHSPPYIAVQGNVTINVFDSFSSTGIQISKEHALRPRSKGPKNRRPADQQLITFPRSSHGSKFNRPGRKQQPDFKSFTTNSDFTSPAPARGHHQYTRKTPSRAATGHPKRTLSFPTQSLTATKDFHSSSSKDLRGTSVSERQARRQSTSHGKQLQSQASTTTSTSFSSSSRAHTSSSRPVFPPPLPTVPARGRRRSKRAPQPHASPSNVFEPALAACRAGAVRDINQKCRDTVLPSRLPHSRPRRATPPVQPSPACPNGGVRSLQRTCTSSKGSVQSSIIALGLG